MSQDVFGIVSPQTVTQKTAKADTSTATKPNAISEFSSELEKYASDSDKNVQQHKVVSEEEEVNISEKSENEPKSQENSGKTLPDKFIKQGDNTEKSSELAHKKSHLESESDHADNLGHMLSDEGQKLSKNTDDVNLKTLTDNSLKSTRSPTHIAKSDEENNQPSAQKKSVSNTLIQSDTHVVNKSSEAADKIQNANDGKFNSKLSESEVNKPFITSPEVVTKRHVNASDRADKKTITTSPVMSNPKSTSVLQEHHIDSVSLSDEADQTLSEAKKPHFLRSDISYAINSRSLASESKRESSEVIFQAISDEVSTTNKSKVVNTEKVMLAQALAVSPELTDNVKEKTSAHLISQVTDRSFSSQLAPSTTASYTNRVDGPALNIQPPIQSAAWSRVMSARVVWMAREGVQQASLQLNPANLGPVEVRLQVSHEQANITFVAQNAMTREALEQAIPRLRESFQQNGMELNNADVSQQSFQQEHNNDRDVDKNSELALLSQSAEEDIEDNVEKIIIADEQNGNEGLSIYA